MSKICGHNREAVKAVLRSLKEYEDFGYKSTPTPSQFYLTCSDPAWSVDDAEAIRRDVSDPAKLAEMLAARGRELGFDDMVVLPGLLAAPNYPKAVIWLHCELIAVEIGTFHSGPMRMPQARAILLQWLGLPDGARDAAEKILRGEA